MRTIVKKWGNSAAVRIPASVMTAAALGLDQAVDVREEGGRIVIEPIPAEAHDLNTLLDRMRPETFPEDIDFGPPRGASMQRQPHGLRSARRGSPGGGFERS